MKDYKRYDTIFWFIYSRFERVVSFIFIVLFIFALLDYLKIISLL